MNLTIILAETDEGFPKLFIVSIIFLKTVESLQISDQEKKEFCYKTMCMELRKYQCSIFRS
jgi:hypothetical protein